ncbi:MAG: ATP-binding protein [Micavibrio sp.]|nr:ATP-binding protein [Micavibrio sp.]
MKTYLQQALVIGALLWAMSAPASAQQMQGTLGGPTNGTPPVATTPAPVTPPPVTVTAPQPTPAQQTKIQQQSAALQPVNMPPPQSAIRPIYLSSKASNYGISPNMHAFPDTGGQMDFRQVLSQFRAGQGLTTNDDQVFLGYSSSAYWLVFGVYNRNPAKSRWILDFGGRMNGTIGVANRMAVYTDLDPMHPIMTDGRLVKNKKQPEGQMRNALPLTFEPGQARIVGIYIEPAAGVPLSLSPQLEEPSVFTTQHDQAVLQANIIKGAAVVIGCAFLFFWITYKSALPVLLMAYLAAQYMIFTTSDEIIAFGNNTKAEYIDWLYAAAALTALELGRILLVGNDRRNQYRYLFNGLALGILALIALSATVESAADFVSVVFIRLGPIVVPIILSVVGGMTVMRTERPQVLPFTVSWVLLLGGTLLTEATASGIASFSDAGINFYWLCFILHLSILSFSALRFLGISDAMHRHDVIESKRRREDEMELRKTKEIADQTRLLGVLQREKELMSDLRTREAERIQAMRRAKEAADSANKAKSDFLAVISHEIRTPMTGVMGMIRLLLDTPLNDKQKEYAKTIQYSGDALITLLNDILDLSKVEEGKMTIENVDFDLGKLVESVVLLMSGRAEEKKIGLKAEIDPETPMALKGDPTRLRQILLNLVGNAIKFTDKGGVTVIVKAHDKTAKKPRIYFAVKDSGIGISEDGQKKLFQPYTQAESSTTRKFGGTGLGLAICKRLVEAMGSSIQIASKIGEGTVFYFIISLEYGAGEGAAAAEAAAMGLVPLKILVVDDNIINQRVVSGLLEKDGHKIITVGGAEPALNELKTVTFDVILMDMEMPQIDGVMATQMIRRLPDPLKSKITIVAMTGNVGKEDIQRCRDAGMDDYISKPVNPDALRKILIGIGKKKYPGGAAPAAAKPAGASAAPAAPAIAAPAQKAPSIAPAAPQPAAQAPAAAPAQQPAPAAPAQPPAAPAAAPAVNMAVFEQQKLFSTEVLGGLKSSLGKDQMDEMMDGLYQKTEELIAGAEKAAQEKDIKALQGFGHDVKGMTSNFGMTALADLGARLERQSKENFSIDILTDIVTKMRPTYYDTRSIVEKWMKAVG